MPLGRANPDSQYTRILGDDVSKKMIFARFFVVRWCVTSDFTPADLLQRCLEIKDDDDSDLKSHQQLGKVHQRQFTTKSHKRTMASNLPVQPEQMFSFEGEFDHTALSITYDDGIQPNSFPVINEEK